MIGWPCLDVCAEEEMRQAVISEGMVVAHFFVTEYITNHLNILFATSCRNKFSIETSWTPQAIS